MNKGLPPPLQLGPGCKFFIDCKSNLLLTPLSRLSMEFRMNTSASNEKNVLGGPLQPCCFDPLTGIYRDGFCHTDRNDIGQHVVCARVTGDFLKFSLEQGNDLITPNQAHNFPGLKEGDQWCLCAQRWKQAYEAGVAPPVYLRSTHEKALEMISFGALKSKALDIH